LSFAGRVSGILTPFKRNKIRLQVTYLEVEAYKLISLHYERRLLISKQQVPQLTKQGETQLENSKKKVHTYDE